MERTSRKIPVTDRQFLWVQDDDKGEVTLHVGPTMVSPTAADRVVIDDGEGGLREDVTGKPQQLVELGDAQYAVLSNPLLETENAPNGKFRPGRNESRPLRNGTRSMIPGPCSFYLRPGQRAEVRDAHELASNQYLVVKVYGEVDKTAPFYEVTARSAGITRATAESLDVTSGLVPLGQVELRRGQLIVIRGLDTQFYIPPSGVDIVPDTSVDASGAAISAATAQRLLAQMQAEATADTRDELAAIGASAFAAAPAPALEEMAQEQVIFDDAADAETSKGSPRQNVPNAVVNQSARSRHRKAPVPARAPAPMGQAAQGPYAGASPAPNVEGLFSSPALRRALEKEAQKTRLIRNAVVLGEKDYCVIVDADGKREIKLGPARVFPGPYDTFMTVGSRSRVYDAYELLPQRALWLRIISAISKEELTRKLPRGFSFEKEIAKDHYYPGDEILLSGVSTFFFPFNEIEVLSPDTGQAVVGNDHERVFIEAIGIDQKSGIYVRDLATGEVRLVRGKQSYLVDPRKEVQITRTVPPADWNLWIASSEPHKATSAAVTTPWAISVVVPNNAAVMVTMAQSRRVVEGPCVTLLGYEESLCPLSLSTGTPKSDASPLRTCFLRTVGNRVSDMIVIETADFVKIAIVVSYTVTFASENKDRWFNHENYIQMMVDHLRSIIRGRCRTLSLSAIWPQIHTTVRDTVLGERKDGQRPGRVFAENSTVVTEVEVLSATIEAPEVADLMKRVQTQSVTLQIGDRQAQEHMLSQKLRAVVDAEVQALAEEAKTREARLHDLARRLTHERSLAEAKDQEIVARERQALADARLAEGQRAALARDHESKAAELGYLADHAHGRAAADRLLATVEIEALAAKTEHELRVVAAHSQAIVAERQAVQRGLVEAMTALGDKIMLGQVAENMNLVSLFKGKDVGTILSEVLGGTKVMPTLGDLRARYGTKVEAAEGGEAETSD